MQLKKAVSLVVGAAATLAFALASSPASAEDKGPLYTAYNLWFEHPQKLASTGYSKGTLLPAGTAIKDLEVDDEEIEFTVASTGQEMRLIFFAKHHPGISAETFANRLFTTKDFAALTASMTADEVAAIKAGEVREGMTRNAVLLARGYPPESKTASLDKDVWQYMASRFKSEEIRFKDGKVTLEAPPPPPAKPEPPKPPSKYLQHNLWFENPENVYSTNYQTGSILPAGTEIQAVAVLSDTIEFTVVDTKMSYSIEFNPKHHPGLPIEKYAERLIGDKGFDALTAGFTPAEIQAIKAGEIHEGMTRNAVLVAAGYPPESKTATLAKSTWTYFASRYATFAVEFKDDKVASISTK